MRAQGQPGGPLGRQTQRLIEAIGVQTLCSAEYGGQTLEGHAHDVVLGLLGGQRRTAGLGMKAQHGRARVSRAEAISHDRRPQATGCAILGHLLEEVVVRVKEETESRRERVQG